MVLFEKEILKRVKRDDPKAFEILFNKYHQKIYSFIDTFLDDARDAENILQDVFINIWETRHRLNEDLPFSSLPYRVAKNKSLNYTRGNVSNKYYMEYISRHQTYSDLETGRKLDYEEQKFFVRKFINELPD